MNTMGGSESSTAAVIRNGDWEHRLCWSESISSIDSIPSQQRLSNGSATKRWLNMNIKTCDKKVESLLEVKRNYFEENKWSRMFDPYIDLACVKSDVFKV